MPLGWTIGSGLPFSREDGGLAPIARAPPQPFPL